MVAFTSKVDIGNRALQHVGADRMGTLGFSEDSKAASEVAFVYDKVREAELRQNFWKFAIKEAALRAIDTTTMLLDPVLWSPTTTYFRSSIVADITGNLWISVIPNNLNNDPLLTSYWQPYFGPLTVSSYDSTQGYLSGELVYTYAGDGTSRVYQSLVDGNTDNPATATAWDATVTYFRDQIVTRTSVAYKSLIDLNLNQDPALAPALWSVSTTYSAGQKVGGSDGMIYQSIGSGNVGNDPTVDAGVHWTNTNVLLPWTSVFVGGSGSVKWLEVGGIDFPNGVGIKALAPNYPLGTGPSSQSFSQNIFRLPANFLRLAPQGQKIPVAWLGGPRGNVTKDWRIESGYLVTSDTGVIILRFVANVTDTTLMDPMFCEGLAARIAIEVAQPITQSDARLQTCASLYKKWMDSARTANAIESGYEDPPDDEYISVRL